MKAFLFVGGSQDGKRIAIQDDNQFELTFNRVEALEADDWERIASGGMSPVVKYESEVYSFRQVAGSSKRFEFFALKSLDADDIMQALVEGYKAPNTKAQGA